MIIDDKITRKEVQEILKKANNLILLGKVKLLTQRDKNKNFLSIHQYDNIEIINLISRLKVDDFCKREHNKNQNHPTNEYVYIFSVRIFSSAISQEVDLYIKFSIQNSLIVISFHELEYPIKFYFK